MPAPDPHPSLLERPWTDPVEHPPSDEHPTSSRSFVVKRACNGCGAQLGDMNDDEMAAAISGMTAPDVRHECRICAPDAPPPLTVGELLDPSEKAEFAHLEYYLGGWEPADGKVGVEAMGLDWVVVRGDDSGRPLLFKVSPDVARSLR